MTALQRRSGTRGSEWPGWKRGKACWWWLAAFGGACLSAAAAEPVLRVSLDPATQLLVLAGRTDDSGRHEMRIETAGLTGVETSRDVNEPGALYLPPPAGAPEGDVAPGAENIFFFNDLIDPAGWELVVRFPASSGGTWKLNGRFSELGGAIRSGVVIPATALERGENLLHFEDASRVVPAMHYRRVIPGDGSFAYALTVGHAAWTGRVALVRDPDTGNEMILAAVEVAGPKPVRREVRLAERWWEDRDGMTESALAVGRNLLHARVVRPGGLFEGGFNLVYDAQQQAYRMLHWVWSWGPSIKLLLDLERLPAAQAAGLAPQFRAAALAAGRRSLDFGMTDPQHPAVGVSTVRWEPSHATPNGWAEYISTADSLFLAGWGWMSLYETTREKVYLERTTTLVAAAERLMDQYPVIPQDWIVERDRWTPHTLDESVFGMIGFTRLHAATQSPEVAAAGRRFLDSHLRHMGREEGLLERAWMRDEDKAVWDPDIKGHAWVIEGYLDAYRLSGESKYMDLARSLAARVIACQADDGAWGYLFQKPGAGDARDDKGTAIWAFLFYDVYRLTRDPQHLAAARRALGWCLRHQYRGDDPHLDGAILNPNAMAYIRRRPMTILYTTTFFGLALLEELALPPDQ